jgi:hypothetical protein
MMQVLIILEYLKEKNYPLIFSLLEFKFNKLKNQIKMIVMKY